MIRTILCRWPWVTLLPAGGIAISPSGLELIHGALYASEAINRELSRFLLCVVGAIITAAIVLEWLLRRWLAERPRA